MPKIHENLSPHLSHAFRSRVFLVRGSFLVDFRTGFSVAGFRDTKILHGFCLFFVFGDFVLSLIIVEPRRAGMRSNSLLEFLFITPKLRCDRWLRRRVFKYSMAGSGRSKALRLLGVYGVTLDLTLSLLRKSGSGVCVKVSFVSNWSVWSFVWCTQQEQCVSWSDGFVVLGDGGIGSMALTDGVPSTPSNAWWDSCCNFRRSLLKKFSSQINLLSSLLHKLV